MKQGRSILVQTDLLPWRHMHRPDQSTQRETQREREREGGVEKLQEEVKESVQQQKKQLEYSAACNEWSWTVEPGTTVAVGLEILIMDDGTTKRWGFFF